MESNWTHVCCIHGIFVFSHTHDVLVVAAAHFLARGITVCQNEGRWIANSQLLNQTTHCILEVRIAYQHDHFHTRAWHVSTHHTESVQSQPEAILIYSDCIKVHVLRTIFVCLPASSKVVQQQLSTLQS